MNLKKLQEELINILVEVDTNPQSINNVGDLNISRYKLAILSGDNSQNNNKCVINFLVGVSCDTYDELLYSIGYVVYKFKDKKLDASGSDDFINFSDDKGFEIFTPESGKWIANLSFSVAIFYDYSYYDDIILRDYIFRNEPPIETVNYEYE